MDGLAEGKFDGDNDDVCVGEKEGKSVGVSVGLIVGVLVKI